MGTQLQINQVYSASPTQVMSMLKDPDYITERATTTGALTVTHTRSDAPDGAVDLVIVRTLPADMPSYARSIVGETLTITEHQIWEQPTARACSGSFDVKFSAPLTFIGTVVLSFDGASTTVVTAGEFKASVPFVGGKVESLALEQTQRYLRKEEQFARAWLARTPESN
ncbi:MAG: DUF2505 domain-containing protein [Actinomycetota bacterium]|nr:DUF2505 domain-containing protein [Actinomycetota bacterium]MDP2289144.1 DUF2505 domain-containing protein [Actinomycetota bacterium]